MAKAPKCRLCGQEHWSGEAHVFAGPVKPLTPVGGREVALTRAEEEELARCEAVIERGLAGFVEVGQALARIQERRLYRLTDDTFDDYCRRRWAFDRTRGYQMIKGARVAAALAAPAARENEHMSTIVDTPDVNARHNEPKTLPQSEGVARELVPLLAEPEALREVWEEAERRAVAGPPTARIVREVREERTAVGPANYDTKIGSQLSALLDQAADALANLWDAATADAIAGLTAAERAEFVAGLNTLASVAEALRARCEE